MLDLTNISSKRSEILNTLIIIITNFPDIVQPHYLLNTILPLLDNSQDPVIITLVIQLLESCDSNKLIQFYPQILIKVYNILIDSTLIYPELISSIIDLIFNLSLVFDINNFLINTHFLEYIEYFRDTLINFEEIKKNIDNILSILSFKLNSNL